MARQHFGIGGIEFLKTLWEAPLLSEASQDQAERAAQTADLHRKWLDYASELMRG